MQNFYYRYLADGSKISVSDNASNGFLYLGAARFAYDANGTSFESMPFSSGRIVNSSNGYEPQYHFTDHLGSTRVVATYDNGWTDIQRKNYSPFGKEWETPFFPESENNFTFSGKEKQTLGDMGFLDFGARFYDAKGAIFLQQDPLAEKYYHIGQYNYCAGNPIKFVDPDGRIPLRAVVKHKAISSKFGVRIDPQTGKKRFHYGVDLSTNETGHKIHALADGKVIVSKMDEIGYGQYVVIEHDKGYQSLYAHMIKDGATVQVGDEVKNGDIIGLSGDTGKSSGPHVHVEISKGNIFQKPNKIDPESISDLQTKTYREFNGGSIEPIIVNSDSKGSTRNNKINLWKPIKPIQESDLQFNNKY